MIKKVETSKRFQARIPASLMDRIEACRDAYARQGIKVNVSAAVQDFLEKETRRMEKEIKQMNPNFVPGQKQEELDL